MTEAILLGHRGYVGSAIAAHLRSIGLPFIGIDRENAAAYRGTPTTLLINATGSSDRQLALKDPRSSLEANVLATQDLLDCFPAERCVHLSSVAVYGSDNRADSTREDTPIDPARLSRYGLYKYLGELLVRNINKRSVILRLGPMVGPGLRKNSVFDLLSRGTLFVHPDSTLPYIDTRAVARIVWDLREEAGQIYNVCGNGTVRLADFARELDVTLGDHLDRLPLDSFDVSIEKLVRRTGVADSWATLVAFANEWRSSPG